MKNCSKDILKYHAEEVTLPKATQDKVRGNRNANRDRLKRGLEKNKKSQPDEFVIQGSYAMKTMTQHPDNDYDIDDGAAFFEDKLKDDERTALTPQQAKEMVCDALIEGGGLKKDPEVKKNCVRVEYAAGHHVDIPVYRVKKTASGAEVRELAGETWRESNPTEITDWFRDEEKKTHQEGEAEPQLRRQTRLMKGYVRNNLKDDALSGLILTVLTAEKHTIYEAREDRAFRNLLQAVKSRLEWNKKVFNPANPSEELTKPADQDKIQKLIDRIAKSLETLRVLDDPDCSQTEAREAWDEVFKTDFFSKLQGEEQASKAPYTPSESYPNKSVNIQGPGTAA
jgi:hypothetical protein